MPEHRIEVKTFLIKKICIHCGGELYPSGRQLMVSPPLYEHICNECGVKTNYNKEYPKLEYKEIK